MMTPPSPSSRQEQSPASPPDASGANSSLSSPDAPSCHDHGQQQAASQNQIQDERHGQIDSVTRAKRPSHEFKDDNDNNDNNETNDTMKSGEEEEEEEEEEEKGMPEFAGPLLPYIKPRAEALAIRRRLTRYMQTRYLSNHFNGHNDTTQAENASWSSWNNSHRESGDVGHLALFQAACGMNHPPSSSWSSSSSASGPTRFDVKEKKTTETSAPATDEKTSPSQSASPAEELLENSNGLRGRYIRALRDNTAAKKAYDEAVQEYESLRTMNANNINNSKDNSKNTNKISTDAVGSNTVGKECSSSSNLQTYLTLLRYRRAQNKLSVLRKFAEELAGMKSSSGTDESVARTTNVATGSGLTDQHCSSTDTGAVGSAVGTEIMKRGQIICDIRGQIQLRQQSQSPRFSGHHGVVSVGKNRSTESGSYATTASVQNGIEMLEKAVLRTKLDADKEGKTIETLRRKYEGQPRSDQTTRLIALSRTRDTLVEWVEEKLASLNTVSNDPLEPEEQENDVTGQDFENRSDKQARLSKTYDAYVEARREFIDAVAECSQRQTKHRDKEKPVPDSLSPAPLLSSPSTTSASPRPRHPSTPTTSTISTIQTILPHIYNHISTCLTPLSLVASLPETQTSHLADITTKESIAVRRVLDRLAVESQLLHEHSPHPEESPVNRSPGGLFTAPLAGSSPGGTNTTQDTIDLASRARVWCLAAENAGIATKCSVSANSEKGQNALKEAEELVREAYRIMGQNYETVVNEEDGDSGCREREVGRGMVLNRGIKSPWARFDGTVGLV